MTSARTSLALWSVLMLASCGGTAVADLDAAATDGGVDAASPDAWVQPIERPPFAAANAVDPADPLYEGQQRFLYDAFGSERLDGWPPASFMLSLMTDEPAVFGDQYAAFGFLPNPDDDFPVGFTTGAEDPTRVHETCSLCHIARLADGRIWLGAPNGALDFGRFRAEVSDRWVASGGAPLFDALEAAKARTLGPGRTSIESSGYPQVVPIDFPPYFDLDALTHFNYLGTGGQARSEIYFSIFAFGAGDPNPTEAIIPFPPTARVDPLIALMTSLRAPPGPAQPEALVAGGRAVFERERCVECHHDDLGDNQIATYDLDLSRAEQFPGDDTRFPHGTIQTDYWHRILIDGEPPITTDGAVDPDAGVVDGGGVDHGRDALLQFIVRNRLAVGPSDGYRSPNLHGLWATAPYLHNGSVPTLDALLRPAAERPTSFMRGDFLVDTTLEANSNQGHEFGTAIDETDRAALVAYLMSL
jgi:hypothetical protein